MNSKSVETFPQIYNVLNNWTFMFLSCFISVFVYVYTCHLFDQDLGHFVVVIERGQVKSREAILLLYVRQLPGTRQDHLRCSEDTRDHDRKMTPHTMVSKYTQP